jgi:PAS domain S-box-containing protein
MSAVERPSSVVGAEVASFDQLHALYVLSDVLARAGDAREIYEAALDALGKTVTPDRSSVLVLDEHHVMRFRAHRGLSDAYRAAVEGHSPWRPDEPAPLPITVEDVREDPSMTSLLPVILGEGIVALAFVPVVYGGKLLGKFMLYFDRPHRFTRPEMLLAETVARHVAFAVARKREGEKLALYREIFERSIDGIAIVDERGAYLEQNAAHQELLGYDDAELAGRTPALHLGEQGFSDGLAQVARDGRARLTVTSTDKSGVPRYIDLSLFAVRGAQTGTVRYVGIKRDVSDLRRALEARQEFLSIASHELKTPVTALSLQLESMLRSLQRGALDSAVSLERLERTRNQVTKIVSLIDKLLDFSRIDAGRLQIDDEPVDVSALVRDSAARFLDTASRAGSTLEIDVRGDLLTRSDAQRLDQIVTNLVSNAVKYGDGKPIVVRAEAIGDAIHVSVRDHGIGIDPAAQERVFARFERAVEARRYAGFGLGLFISRELAEALGCTLTLESTLGEGSTFTLVVPRR